LVELYLHSPNTPSWRDAQLGGAQGLTFTFYLLFIYFVTNFFSLLLYLLDLVSEVSSEIGLEANREN
jgi:hypothetical protein